MGPANRGAFSPWTFLSMVFFVLCCIAILSQLNAQHGPTWPQLGAQNRPKNLPKMASKSDFQRKTENLEF